MDVLTTVSYDGMVGRRQSPSLTLSWVRGSRLQDWGMEWSVWHKRGRVLPTRCSLHVFDHHGEIYPRTGNWLYR